MGSLNLHTQFNNDSTMVSNIFIDKYMSDANGEFVKIYLYLLRCVSNSQLKISVDSIADFFNQTEADICRALKYWDKKGVISLTLGASGKTITDITFCKLSNDTDIAAAVDSEASDIAASDCQDNTVNFSEATRRNTSNIITAYTPEQIEEFNSQTDFKLMIYGIQQVIGKVLNTTELSTIAYFYDKLDFSVELIEYLIESCVSKGHKKFSYIQTVALNWHSKGITTIKEAKLEACNHSDTAFSIQKAFGITNRSMAGIELDFINKWTTEYGFDIDIIIEACNRTIKAIHQPSFDYADSILKKWKDKNISSIDQIQQADSEFDSKNTRKYSTTNTSTTRPRANRFNNFSQREISIDESELISNNG